MKTIQYIVMSGFLMLCLIVGTSSCSSFEDEPLEWKRDQKVWENADSLGIYALQQLYGIYIEMPVLHNRISSDYLDASTDDAVSSVNSNQPVTGFRDGRWSPVNVIDNRWTECYSGIRRANTFLANVDRVPLSKQLQDAEVVKQWKAEARCLRAYFYFELVKRWGGVPLVGNKVYDVKDKIEVAKSSADQCFEYIVTELDAVKDDLIKADKLADTEIGRMTNGAALAIKARTLLYAASPLFNPSNDKSKWQRTAEAAKAVIDMKKGAAPQYTLQKDPDKIFLDYKNGEMIVVRMTGTTSQELEELNSPVGCGNAVNQARGMTSPSHDLAKAFPLKNGKAIDSGDPGFDPKNPYKNRDPRLLKTLFCNGESRWLKRTIYTYEGGPDKPNTNGIQTRTGYYMRKFMGKFEESTSYSAQKHGFHLIRLAEIYLIYAEALNEIGPDANTIAGTTSNRSEILTYLREIRKRAGITAGTESGQYGISNSLNQNELRKCIRNERRIELAFEEHRFFDIRRWNIASETLNKPVTGVKITKNADNSFTYEEIEVAAKSNYQDYMNLFPVPAEELYGNVLMTQNPGW
ncbi:MAG: RagB/SusD family nutrient uptake outer membrane protein [Dysgonamonadaceae bacterium]|jgi:hypothetical protein|nr:RagB/SusD family nutrient uptake outer membrane protein [Dysgonamonadaceae bacterium]